MDAAGGVLERYPFEVDSPYADPIGIPDVIPVPLPGANTNATIKVEKFPWKPVAISFVLTCDANAANRIVDVRYQYDDARIFCHNGPGRFQVASEVTSYSGKAHQGVSDWTSSGADFTPVYFPLEPMKLDVGTWIVIAVGNKQAADALSAIFLSVVRYVV